MGQAFIASDKKGRLKILISSFQTTFWVFQGMGFNRISLLYSGLTLNQYGVASPKLKENDSLRC